MPLANWLYEKNITSLGTIQNNRVGVPAPLKTPEGKKNLDYVAYWEKTKGDLKLHSYTVQNKSGKAKNVNVLTTLDTHLGVTIDDGKRKPAAIKLYDYTKDKWLWLFLCSFSCLSV